MFRSNGNFDKLLEKATSNLRLEPDWPSILEICDLIRQNDCPPRYAVMAIKKKLTSTNPHQAMFALLVLESIVKNCGSGVHDEVASVSNCESYRSLVKAQTHENVRTKILELMQAWAYAFRNIPKYRSVQDAVNILKAEGYKFPTLKESDAMFSADSAPEWSDGDVCHRCRVQFTVMTRKHHCRACGQVFCQQCSAKTTTLPKFGIEKEVRVCDACLEQVKKPVAGGAPAKSETSEISSSYVATAAQETPAPKGKTADEIREEEELQLAIALSQSEAEQKEKEKVRAPPAVHTVASDLPSFADLSHGSPPNSASPAELSRYLDRNMWEKLAQSNQSEPPSAPTPSPGPPATMIDPMINKIISLKLENGSTNPEMDEFVTTLKSQVEIFVNRMKSNSSRGRSIANDSSVQTLFMNITAMHSRLLRFIQQIDDNRLHYEGLQDKLTQVKDSRAALDVLREEHAERVRRAAEQAEIQRQLQMAHKLDVMRKKKQEYLQYQRQLALQRVQEQEREMQMRQEQQKHQYMIGGGVGPFYMQGSPVHQFPGSQPPQPGYNLPGYPNMMMPGMPPQVINENPGMMRHPGVPQGQPMQQQQQSGQQQHPQMNMHLPGMPHQPQPNQMNQVPSLGQLPPGMNPMRQGGQPLPPHMTQQGGQMAHMNQQGQMTQQPQAANKQQPGGQGMQGPGPIPPNQQHGSPQMNMPGNQPMHQAQMAPASGQMNQQIQQMPQMPPHMGQAMPPHQIGQQQGGHMGQPPYHMMHPGKMMYMDQQQMNQHQQMPGHMLPGQGGAPPPHAPHGVNQQQQPMSHPPNQMPPNQQGPPTNHNGDTAKIQEQNRSPTTDVQVTSSPVKSPPQPTVSAPEEISTAELICFD